MKKKNLLPFSVSLLIILLDQATKVLIVRFVKEGETWKSFFNDYLRIIHVRNDAVAFSLGSKIPYAGKIILFVILPIIVMGVLAYVIGSDKTKNIVTEKERWCLAGIFGGGCGNIIDRVLRNLRVVDWISTNNYGWFGMERFPTYNIADASVVISVILFFFIVLVLERKKT